MTTEIVDVRQLVEDHGWFNPANEASCQVALAGHQAAHELEACEQEERYAEDVKVLLTRDLAERMALQLGTMLPDETMHAQRVDRKFYSWDYKKQYDAARDTRAKWWAFERMEGSTHQVPVPFLQLAATLKRTGLPVAPTDFYVGVPQVQLALASLTYNDPIFAIKIGQTLIPLGRWD